MQGRLRVRDGVRRVGVVVSVSALAIAVSACGSTRHNSGSTATPASTACAWPTRADKATLNVAYPDTASTYWSTSYRLAPGERLELRAGFPSARYFSFVTYGPVGGAISKLTDRDINPDPGGGNPYRAPSGTSGTSGHYTVNLETHTSSSPNTLAAAQPSANPGSPTTTSTVPQTPGTVAPLGSGAPDTAGVVGGTIIYRVYLSRVANDPTGGVVLPEVTDIHADGTRVAVPTCAHAEPNPAATTIVDQNGPPTNTPAPAIPAFIRPQKGATNLYPDPDNIYLATIVHYTPGQVVVVRGKAPTFPNTSAGAPINGHEQVRYWSLCTNEYRKPYPVSFCVPDQDTSLDSGGFYTIVISTPADRPANATATNHVTWLDWGSTTVDNLLLVRHMLPEPGFSQSARNVAPGALATTTMGAYAPRATYCTTQAFAQHGLAGCANA